MSGHGEAGGVGRPVQPGLAPPPAAWARAPRPGRIGNTAPGACAASAGCFLILETRVYVTRRGTEPVLAPS